MWNAKYTVQGLYVCWLLHVKCKITVQGLCNMLVDYCMQSAKYTVQELAAANYTVLFWQHLTSTWNRIVNKYVQIKGISDLTILFHIFFLFHVQYRLRELTKKIEIYIHFLYESNKMAFLEKKKNISTEHGCPCFQLSKQRHNNRTEKVVKSKF